MAHIRKVKNGNYQASIYAGTDYKGKKLYKYVTKPTLKECKAKVKEIEYEIQNKTFINVQNIRLADYLDKWYELNSARLSPTTLRPYKIYIEKKFKPYLGHLKLLQITPIHIKEFYNDMLKINKSKTVLKYHCVLNAALEEVLKNKNPCREVKAPKKEKYIPRILTESEFTKLKCSIKESENELPILMGAWMGMRLGEIFGLRWRDVDIKNGFLSVNQTQVKVGKGNYILKSPKSESGKRTIAIPEYILYLLKTLKSKKKVISELVFDIKPDVFSKRYERILKNLNLPKTRFHDLRHYNATKMLENGIPDLYTSHHLGHAQVSTTKQVYQHVRSEMQKTIDNKLKEIFK